MVISSLKRGIFLTDTHVFASMAIVVKQFKVDIIIGDANSVTFNAQLWLRNYLEIVSQNKSYKLYVLLNGDDVGAN